MKIRCNKCGTEFDSNFCPNCGSPREDNAVNNQTENIQTGVSESESNLNSLNDQAPKSKTKETIINIFRWCAIAFLSLMLIGLLVQKAWLSAFFVVLAILVITPLNKKVPIIIPRFSYGAATFVLFIISICFYPSTTTGTKEVSETSAQNQTSEESVTVVQMDRRTQKKIAKIEKYIANEKYEKAYKEINDLEVDESEKVRLYALYYTGIGEFTQAEEALYAQCAKHDPLSDNEMDPLYAQLLELYDKVPDKQGEIDLLKHSVYVSQVGYEEGHDWIDAGCTTKKKCKICGEETGEPLGHDWQEATCTDAKKCSRCGETEGDPLGHDVASWTIIQKPTCNEEGIEKGVCARCNEEVEQSVAKTEHTPGNWEITKETTSASVPGEKSLICKVCGEVLETEQYTITKEEELKAYKDSFEAVSYEELSRYPDSYKDKKIKVTVTIVDEIEEGIILFTPYKAKMGGKDIALSDGREVKEPKLLKGDKVTVYGVGDGTETIKTKERGLLWDKTVDKTEIPMVKIQYVEIK